ncbi:MAG: tRNA lysidine(34) synthetase TilS [Lentisphaerae bacterium]|nr:tRNA lysidine(34) synthetase TilS [Lentisphaerota bacterium]
MTSRRSTLVSDLATNLKRRGLLNGHSHLLLAVSGGADSVALLVALNALKPSMGLELTVAHLDHQLRGAEARSDAAFVGALSRKLKVACVTGRRDVRRLARRKHLSIEMAAREARYHFLQQTALKQGASVVVTAHNADDQAETVLLRLARGCGPAGLGGIRWRVRLSDLLPGVRDTGLEVIRPLLDRSRVEIEAFLHQQGQTWREDASNASVAFLRNRVRHELLPLLETRLNPKIRTALWRTADILSEEEVWLDQMADVSLRSCADADGRLERSALTALPPPLGRRVIRKWLMASALPVESMDWSLAERVGALAADACGSRAVDLPGPWRVVRRYGFLAVVASRSAPEPFRVVLTRVGETLLPEQGLRILIERRPGVVRERGASPGVLPATASLSAKAVGRRRLYVRCPRPGDRIQPYGMRGSKKLQDILVDAKLPAEQRGELPLLECGGEIAWIPGYRIAHGFRVEDEESPALHIRIERL